MITRSKTGNLKLKSYTTTAIVLPIAPKDHKLALDDPSWCKTVELEYNALKQKKTRHLIPSFPDQNLITNKWVFRVKN